MQITGKANSVSLADLPNFGHKSRQMLAQEGIHTLEQLRELGAVSGRHWRDVAKHDRLRLLLELEDIENEYER